MVAFGFTPRMSPLWRKIDAVDRQRRREQAAIENARLAELRRKREEREQAEAEALAKLAQMFPRPRLPRNRQRIIAEVAAKHDLTVTSLKGERRTRPFVRARQEAFYRLRAELRLSFPQIGAIFDRDHTTVLHGVRSFAERNGLPLP